MRHTGLSWYEARSRCLPTIRERVSYLDASSDEMLAVSLGARRQGEDTRADSCARRSVILSGWARALEAEWS